MGSGAQHLTPVLLPEYWSNPSRYKSAVLSPRTAAQDTPLSNHISRISAPNLTTWSISSLSKFKYCLKADLYLNCSGSNPVPSSISLISKNKHSYTKDYSWNFSGTFPFFKKHDILINKNVFTDPWSRKIVFNIQYNWSTKN